LIVISEEAAVRSLILGCGTIAADAIEQAPFLTEDQKRDILYHNAVRFLRLEEDASRTRPSREEQPWEP
jgi:hypothetical protein